MRRQPQARGTKSKGRINSFYELEEKTKNAGQNDRVELSVKTSRQGNKILELHHLKQHIMAITFIKEFQL